MYKQIKINITREQLNKALNNKPVSFKREQIGAGSNYLSLHPANVKLVEKAAMKGSGCVLHLAPGELMATAEDMGGEGIFGDVWKGLKSGYKWVKKNIIDTPLYQQGIKPMLKTAVNQGAQALKAYAPQAATAIDMGVNAIGKETGAFGLKTDRRTKAQKRALLMGRGLYLS